MEENTGLSLTDTTDTLVVVVSPSLKMKIRTFQFILRNHAAKSSPSPLRAWSQRQFCT